jgi:hypothetical protein
MVNMKRKKIVIMKNFFFSFFLSTVVMHKEKEENGVLHIHHHQAHDSYRCRELGIIENGILDGDMFLQVSFSHNPFCLTRHRILFPGIVQIKAQMLSFGWRTSKNPKVMKK